ncbi:MAG: dihydrodipicolinate synthase family protein [Lautropia sp.]
MSDSALGLRGLVAFPVTPTMHDERVDAARLRSLLDEVLADGVDGVVVLGSSGGSVLFPETERMKIAELTLAHVAGRVPVMVGTGALTTAESIQLSRHAAQHGASAVLVVPIAYWRLREQELIEHFWQVADAIDIPLCLYNNPRLTLTDMSPALMARIGEHPRIRSVKESASDVQRLAEIRRVAPSMHLATGRDGQAIDGMASGAQGWHCAMANLAPQLCVQVYGLCRAGRFDEARAAWAPIERLVDFCVENGLIRSLHAALGLLGRPVGSPPRPILPLTAAELERLGALLRSSALAPKLGDAE